MDCEDETPTHHDETAMNGAHCVEWATCRNGEAGARRLKGYPRSQKRSRHRRFWTDRFGHLAFRETQDAHFRVES